MGFVHSVPCVIAQEKQHKTQADLGDARISDRLGLTLVQDLAPYNGWAQFKFRSGHVFVKHCRNRCAVSWSCYTPMTSPGQQSEMLRDTSYRCEETMSICKHSDTAALRIGFSVLGW